MADRALLEELRNQIVSMEGAPSHGGRSDAAPIPSGRKRGREVDFTSADDAFSKIVALVNASDRSEKALCDRLAKSGFGAEAIEASVERAKTYGFIDDARFADVLIRSRLAQGKGIEGIRRELDAHSIAIEDVPGWPDEYMSGADTEFERAMALLERKPPRSKNLRDGAYRKLVAKGFSASVASSASRQWFEGIQLLS